MFGKHVSSNSLDYGYTYIVLHIILTLMQMKQHNLEQWGQSLASLTLSMQMKHLNISARFYKEVKNRINKKSASLSCLLQDTELFMRHSITRVKPISLPHYRATQPKLASDQQIQYVYCSIIAMIVLAIVFWENYAITQKKFQNLSNWKIFDNVTSCDIIIFFLNYWGDSNLPSSSLKKLSRRLWRSFLDKSAHCQVGPLPSQPTYMDKSAHHNVGPHRYLLGYCFKLLL